MADKYMVEGFRASGVAAGIKKRGGLDLGLIVADAPATAAGLFTTNRVQAPSVKLCKQRLRSGKAQAILVNSGNANTAVGRRGMQDAMRATASLAHMIRIPSSRVLMSSTGVIGEFLPLDKLENALPDLFGSLSPGGMENFARAIMTTDTFPKLAVREFKIGNKKIKIVGAAKGSGMIMPQMATMLAYVLTDADITRPALKSALKAACEQSFNAITVDGDMSTSDTLLAMASARAGNRVITSRGKDFIRALTEVCGELSDMMVKDGEGATRMFRIEVRGARSGKEADRIARRVANSPLVKTAFHAGDPNWGRVLAAAGSAGVNLDPGKVDVDFAGENGSPNVEVVRRGNRAASYREPLAAEILSAKIFRVIINLHAGRAAAIITTCDLSANYVKINAEYRT